MSEHTPGPWRQGKRHADRIVALTNTVVAETYGCVNWEEDAANARLIAAAPKLLAEMKRYLPILEQCEQGTRWVKYTEGTGIATLNGYLAAIAEAEGK